MGFWSVAAVLVYDRELSLADIEATEDYLSVTYAIPLERVPTPRPPPQPSGFPPPTPFPLLAPLASPALANLFSSPPPYPTTAGLDVASRRGDSNLEAGPIAGIVVGSLCGCLLILLAVVVMLRRQRRWVNCTCAVLRGPMARMPHL